MANNLADRIKKIRLSRALDQGQFGALVGASQSTVARWEGGSQPKPDALKKISEMSGMSIDDLVGAAKPELVVEGYAVRWVPLIGLAPASSWRESVSMPMGEVSVRADKAGRKAFAVEIKGDSMDRLLPEGGWAVIDPDQSKFYDNKIYLVSNDEHEVTIKRYKSNPARLEPASFNPDHETISISGLPVNIIGRVVAYGNDQGL